MSMNQSAETDRFRNVLESSLLPHFYLVHQSILAPIPPSTPNLYYTLTPQLASAVTYMAQFGWLDINPRKRIFTNIVGLESADLQ
jgi:hypothetical protein